MLKHTHTHTHTHTHRKLSKPKVGFWKNNKGLIGLIDSQEGW